MATIVNDANFDAEVLKSDKPVFVDFYADWCGPCKVIAPVIEQLATENDGKAKVVKLDVDASQATAQQYQVTSIPTLLLFKGGEVVGKIVGAQPKAKLQELIDQYL